MNEILGWVAITAVALFCILLSISQALEIRKKLNNRKEFEDLEDD